MHITSAQTLNHIPDFLDETAHIGDYSEYAYTVLYNEHHSQIHRQTHSYDEDISDHEILHRHLSFLENEIPQCIPRTGLLVIIRKGGVTPDCHLIFFNA